MKTVKFKGSAIVFFAVVSLFASFAFSEQDDNKTATDSSDGLSLADQVKNIDVQIDPAAWNIRNGCVVLRRIKRIKFVDDQTAMMSMRGKNQGRNKIILRLRRECQYQEQRFCSPHDRFKVVRRF